MLKNLRFVIVVALACAMVMAAGCSKSDDKSKKNKPKAAIDAAAKKTAKSQTDAAATPVKKDDDDKDDDDKDDDAKPTGKKLTNLKILPKDWTFKKAKAFMKETMNRGLGVKCEFCHNEKDWASDKKKHKVVARKMMQMTATLNKKYFRGKHRVTCFTCHMGKKEPGRHKQHHGGDHDDD